MRSFKISVVKFLTVVLAMLMLGTLNTSAQVSVTLPTIAGPAGSDKLGAVKVGDLTGQNVMSFEFTINYDKNVVYILGTDDAGTLTEGTPATVNADTAAGKIVVAWASGTALTSPSTGGTLLNLKFHFRNSGTAALSFGGTFKFNAGTPASTTTDGSAVTPKVLVQGGSVSATEGDDIRIPIMVSEIESSDNVMSFDFTATYNKDVISITGFDYGEASDAIGKDGAASINTSTAGTVTLAWANGANITGSGTLIYLLGKALAAGTSDVNFTAFKFNIGTPGSYASAGQVVVAAKPPVNVAPTLALNPAGPAFTVAENSALNIALVGADANTGDVLTYSFTSTPAATGATIDASTGAFAWTPAYGTHGSYSIVFKVADQGGLSATVTATVTVSKTNRAPVFTDSPAANTIVPVHKAPNPVYWDYTYKATDADNDALLFSLVTAPTGASITSDGKFSWAPALNQAGQSFVVTVQVTDGTAVTTNTVVLAVSSTITGVEDQLVPSDYSLSQNYPNPFNPTTLIKFGLPNESHVRLTVFNVLGQEVSVLVNRIMPAGFHNVQFNAANMNTGLYIYKIEADNFVQVKKMMLIK